MLVQMLEAVKSGPLSSLWDVAVDKAATPSQKPATPMKAGSRPGSRGSQKAATPPNGSLSSMGPVPGQPGGPVHRGIVTWGDSNQVRGAGEYRSHEWGVVQGSVQEEDIPKARSQLCCWNEARPTPRWRTIR